VAAAWDAVRFVKNHIKHGSNNSVKDWLFKPPMSVVTSTVIQVHGAKTLIEPELRKLGAAGGSSMEKERRNLLMMEVWAKHALTMQAGNCGIQAAVAFEYLRNHKKMFPVEVMEFRHLDHAFCILGRDKDSDLEDFAAWTKDAIVCDPWRGNVGVAGQLVVWFKQTAVNSICRVDSEDEQHALGYHGPSAYEFTH
jgi:hypothetical protein